MTPNIKRTLWAQKEINMSNIDLFYKVLPSTVFQSTPNRQSILDHHEQIINKFFDEFWGNRKNFIHSNTSYPKLDIYEDEHYFCIDAAVPGVEEKDLDIEIVKETRLLTIRGKQTVLRVNRYHDHLKELKHSAFSRTIQLPEYVDLESESVSLKFGVLYMNFNKIIPKDEEPKETVKKISINKS